MEVYKNDMFADTLVLVHVSRQELIGSTSKQKSIHDYMKRIQNRIELYLKQGKPVYFTLLSSHIPSEFEQLREKVTFIPLLKTPGNPIVKQGITVRNRIILAFQGQVIIEFAGGYEFACYGTTISTILKGHDTSNSLSKIRYTKNQNEIEEYVLGKRRGVIKGGWAFVENIF